MTTNILFGTNSQFLDATVTASSEATGYGGNNCLTGGKLETWKTDGAVAGASLEYAAAAAVDYAILGRADILIDVPTATFHFHVQYSDNDIDWSTWHTSAPLLTGAAAGVNSASGGDYCVTDTASASHPYWKLVIDPSENVTVELAKFYLGTALDLGRDPVEIKISRKLSTSLQYRPLYELSLEYVGISYDNAMALNSQIIERAEYHPFWVFTRTNHGPLFNQYCFFVELADAEIPQVMREQNNVTLFLREVM